MAAFWGCAPAPHSGVQFQIIDPARAVAQQIVPQSTPTFGLSALDSSVCYALHVTAPDLLVHEDENDDESCTGDNGPSGLGQLHGMFPYAAANGFSFSVEIGKARRFDLLAFRKTLRNDIYDSDVPNPDAAPADCPAHLTAAVDADGHVQLYANGQLFEPQELFLATATKDIVAGDNLVTLELVRNSDGSIGVPYGNCDDSPPAGLSYSDNFPTYYETVPIVGNVPNSTGGDIEYYTVSPTLPAGLSLNSTTGVISGTPTALSSSATYTITAMNKAGSTTATIDIEVLPAGPSILTIFTGASTAGNTQQFAVDSAGNIYYGAVNSYEIRKITNGVESVFAGDGSNGSLDGTGTAAKFLQPSHIFIDASDNLYVADAFNVRKITPGAVVTTVGPMSGGGLQRSLVADASGNVYFTFQDANVNVIRKMDPGGSVTTFAGQTTAGFADGVGAAAQFNNPHGLAIDSADNVYVADVGNYAIRKIAPNGTVTTLAGNGVQGIVDGVGAAARFYFYADPQSGGYSHMGVDASNNIFLGDMNFSTVNGVRKIQPDGTVTTVCGPGSGVQGDCGSSQIFSRFGLAVGADGSIYFMDTSDIKKIEY